MAYLCAYYLYIGVLQIGLLPFTFCLLPNGVSSLRLRKCVLTMLWLHSLGIQQGRRNCERAEGLVSLFLSLHLYIYIYVYISCFRAYIIYIYIYITVSSILFAAVGLYQDRFTKSAKHWTALDRTQHHAMQIHMYTHGHV